MSVSDFTPTHGESFGGETGPGPGQGSEVAPSFEQQDAAAEVDAARNAAAQIDDLHDRWTATDSNYSSGQSGPAIYNKPSTRPPSRQSAAQHTGETAGTAATQSGEVPFTLDIRHLQQAFDQQRAATNGAADEAGPVLPTYNVADHTIDGWVPSPTTEEEPQPSYLTAAGKGAETDPVTSEASTPDERDDPDDPVDTKVKGQSAGTSPGQLLIVISERPQKESAITPAPNETATTDKSDTDLATGGKNTETDALDGSAEDKKAGETSKDEKPDARDSDNKNQQPATGDRKSPETDKEQDGAGIDADDKGLEPTRIFGPGIRIPSDMQAEAERDRAAAEAEAAEADTDIQSGHPDDTGKSSRPNDDARDSRQADGPHPKESDQEDTPQASGEEFASGRAYQTRQEVEALADIARGLGVSEAELHHLTESAATDAGAALEATIVERIGERLKEGMMQGLVPTTPNLAIGGTPMLTDRDNPIAYRPLAYHVRTAVDLAAAGMSVIPSTLGMSQEFAQTGRGTPPMRLSLGLSADWVPGTPYIKDAKAYKTALVQRATPQRSQRAPVAAITAGPTAAPELPYVPTALPRPAQELLISIGGLSNRERAHRVVNAAGGGHVAWWHSFIGTPRALTWNQRLNEQARARGNGRDTGISAFGILIDLMRQSGLIP